MSERTETEIKSMTKEQNYMCGYRDGKSDVLDKLRAEIEQDLEQDKIARSVFRYEKINAVKAEQCTGSIAAYNGVIGIIDKYKAESENKA